MELVDDSVVLWREAHFISKDEQKSMQDLPLILRAVASNCSNMHHPNADTYFFHLTLIHTATAVKQLRNSLTAFQPLLKIEHGAALRRHIQLNQHLKKHFFQR